MLDMLVGEDGHFPSVGIIETPDSPDFVEPCGFETDDKVLGPWTRVSAWMVEKWLRVAWKHCQGRSSMGILLLSTNFRLESRAKRSKSNGHHDTIKLQHHGHWTKHYKSHVCDGKVAGLDNA